MRNLVRAAGACAFAVASTLATAGAAAAAVTPLDTAAVTVPFQINPAAFGNPNGSFDVPPSQCAVVVGEHPGSVRITGGKPGGWGCLIEAETRWLNLSTGATGSARLSNGLNGFPPEATIDTGAGQVAIALLPLPGNTTPGFATFQVP